MVLFNDTLPPKPKTLFSKCLTWAIRIVLLVIGLFILFVGCLNLLQGKGEAQKGGIEKTLSRVTGKETHIAQLNNFTLFPEIVFDMKGIKNGLFSDTQITVQDFLFRAPGVLLVHRNGVFRDINIKHINFMKDNQAVRSIDSIEVVDEESLPPYISIQFSRPSPLELRLDIEPLATNARGQQDYKIKKSSPFSFHWEDKTLSGRLFTENGKYYITGSGENMDASVSPFFSVDHTNIECFIGEFKFSGSKILIQNGLIKTQGSHTLHNIFPLEINLFEEKIRILESQTDILLSPKDSLIEKSDCAPYLNDTVTFIKNQARPTHRHPELVSGSHAYIHQILKQVQDDGRENDVFNS